MGPPASLRAWRDYADVVAVASVEGAERGDPTGSGTGAGAGENVIPRLVDLVVDDVLWARHDISLERFSLQSHGWVIAPESGERELLMEGEQELEIGRTYIVALARNLEGSWLLLSPDSAVRVEGDRAVRAAEGAQGITDEISSLAPETVQERLDALPPDPAVERYADHSPHLRYELVIADREGDAESIFADASRHPTTTVPVPG